MPTSKNMGNVIDFVAENGHLTFDEAEFCEADSLVFSQLSYLKYDNFFISETSDVPCIRFSELAEKENKEELFIKVRDPHSNKSFFEVVSQSKRYADVLITDYINNISVEEEKQFSAVTFLIGADLMYIAYRGTDSTFIGWKEDFNMSFMTRVPSQLEGVKYFDIAASKNMRKIIVGGHSKGGNIAVYSAVNCNEAFKKRILNIYNHDGPGFKDGLSELPIYNEMKERIHKTVPKSSVIGLMLQQHEEYRIVDSDRMGIMQHDPFSWKISGWDFVVYEKLTPSSEYMHCAINQWLCSISDEQRKVFMDTLFSVLNRVKADSVCELKENWRSDVKLILGGIDSIDKDTKKFILKTFALFVKFYGKGFYEVTASELKGNSVIEKIQLQKKQK